jgi:sugar lactone lactonase YvrE
MTPSAGSAPSFANTPTTPMAWPLTRKAVSTAAVQGAGPSVRFEPDGSTTTIVNALDGVPLNTPNDLAIDRQGRIWFSNPWNAGNIASSEHQVLDHNSILCANPQPDDTRMCQRMTAETTVTMASWSRPTSDF